MIISKTFDYALIKNDFIVIDDSTYDLKKGKHSLWIPKAEIKIVWSYNGKLSSFKDWEKSSNVNEVWDTVLNDKNNEEWGQDSLESIENEVYMFNEFHKDLFTPSIDGVFFIKTVTSDFIPDRMITDVSGVYGYFMKDANKLPKGKYTFEKFIDEYYDRLILSDWTLERTDRSIGKYGGALGDLQKLDNTVNGYLIDVRRTLWDMIKLKETN